MPIRREDVSAPFEQLQVGLGSRSGPGAFCDAASSFAERPERAHAPQVLYGEGDGLVVATSA